MSAMVAIFFMAIILGPIFATNVAAQISCSCTRRSFVEELMNHVFWVAFGTSLLLNCYWYAAKRSDKATSAVKVVADTIARILTYEPRQRRIDELEAKQLNHDNTAERRAIWLSEGKIKTMEEIHAEALRTKVSERDEALEQLRNDYGDQARHSNGAWEEHLQHYDNALLIEQRRTSAARRTASDRETEVLRLTTEKDALLQDKARLEAEVQAGKGQLKDLNTQMREEKRFTGTCGKELKDLREELETTKFELRGSIFSIADKDRYMESAGDFYKKQCTEQTDSLVALVSKQLVAAERYVKYIEGCLGDGCDHDPPLTYLRHYSDTLKTLTTEAVIQLKLRNSKPEPLYLQKNEGEESSDESVGLVEADF